MERKPILRIELLSLCFEIQWLFLFLHYPNWNIIVSYLPWHYSLLFFGFTSYFNDFLFPISYIASLFCLSSKCWNAPYLRPSPLSHSVHIFFLIPQSKKSDSVTYFIILIAFSANTYHLLMLSLHTHTHRHTYNHIYFYYCFNFISFYFLGYNPHENKYLHLLAHLCIPANRAVAHI